VEEIMKKSEYDLARARREQLLIGLNQDNILIDEDGLRKSYKIKIPDDPDIVSMCQKERAMFERGQVFQDFPWRWAAGGLGKILILDDCIVMLTIQKNGGTYKGHDTIGAGLAGSFEEMLAPDIIALRESEEEIIVRLGNEICYSVYKCNKNITLDMRSIAEGSKNLRKETVNCNPKGFPSEILHFENGYNLMVEWKDWSSSYSGIGLFMDAGCKGIDYITASKTKINARLSDLIMYDGEIIGGVAWDRLIKAHELNESFAPTGTILAKWKSGQIDTTVHNNKDPMIPHTKWLFNLLKKQ
jgi:hypothetical protein